LEWIVIQQNGPRGKAVATSPSDTFNDLAKLLHLDTKDYRKWLATSDTRPKPCKEYSFPNTIYVDVGIWNWYDYAWISVLRAWAAQAVSASKKWIDNGFMVVWSEYAIGESMRPHLSDPDLYGYVYVGHGADGAIIGIEDPSKSGDKTKSSALAPDRYTHHGIAFMQLKACNSADYVPAAGRHAKYTRNAWESNVATRGYFVGYEGSVDRVSEVFRWFTTSGKNDDPYQIK